MAAERESMLIMKNVSKTFNPGTVNEKCALNGVNLTLGAGDFVTIVGSNGVEYQFLLKGHEDLRQDERVARVLAP